jgi:CRP/FNR family transcriptional regulator, cyclic AMP receptor protein
VAKPVSNTTEFQREYADGELICSEGDVGSEMFIIQSGSVRIFKRSKQGPIDLATLEKGNFFGEMSVLEGLPRDATAQALGPTKVMVMNAGALLMRLRRDPTLAFELLHGLSGRVRVLNSRLLSALEASGASDAARAHASGRIGTMMMFMRDDSRSKSDAGS